MEGGSGFPSMNELREAVLEIFPPRQEESPGGAQTLPGVSCVSMIFLPSIDDPFSIFHVLIKPGGNLKLPEACESLVIGR